MAYNTPLSFNNTLLAVDPYVSTSNPPVDYNFQNNYNNPYTNNPNYNTNNDYSQNNPYGDSNDTNNNNHGNR
jgi:hypothetical protein